MRMEERELEEERGKMKNMSKEQVCTENKPLCIKRVHTDNIMMSACDKCEELCSEMKYSTFEK